VAPFSGGGTSIDRIAADRLTRECLAADRYGETQNEKSPAG
jgi:hypothetical protein